MLLLNTYCSLGINCFTRTTLTKWKLKPTKKEGELSLPFDLCVCPINSVFNILNNNFVDYFDNIYFDTKLNLFKNSKYKIIYNHDTDIHEVSKLKERYTRRINNFYKIYNNRQKKIFIISTINDSTDLNIVKKIYNKVSSNNSILIWIHIGKIDVAKNDEINEKNQLNYCHIPNPYPNFWGEWYKPIFYNSDKGKQFETDYLNHILDISSIFLNINLFNEYKI